jgi:hypothetical protein
MENVFIGTLVQGAIKAPERERSFKLSLPALVTGMDAYGREFRERTRIISASSEKATFFLKSKIVIGTPISLAVEIPKTLILQDSLNLLLTGKVTLVQKQKDNKYQDITLDLKRSYKIFSTNLS